MTDESGSERKQDTASRRNRERLEAMLPAPDTDVAELLRNERLFAAMREAFAGLFHADVESVPAWRGPGTTYLGIDGFREMWLDWLEPWATYRVQVDELIEAEDSVVVLVRDRARRPDMREEVELIAGSVWTFRDGKIGRVAFYANRDELREAIGLRR